MSARYALYLAPEADEPLWCFGCEWLGYDAQRSVALPHPRLPGIEPQALHEATAHPRVYGFHMTLKAPFRLASDASPDDLEAAVGDLASRHHAFGPFQLAPDLRPAGDGKSFLCLHPIDAPPALSRLEADAVVGLDRWRAPLDAAERARRKPERLAPHELAYLDRHGYPYVLDAFRPHFSLTGPVEDGASYLAAVREALASNPPLAQVTVRSLALFEQPAPGARFRVRRRFPLAERHAAADLV